MRKQQWTNNGKNSRKYQHGSWRKSETKKMVIDEARKEANTVHLTSLMDICHLKNSELEPKHQKYKGRVVLRSDLVKDDSGSCAVSTEQGSSASQMTAAKVMDVIARLPGCAGQTADAVSAYTQVKMEDAPSLLQIPKSECPDIWIRLPKHKCPKSWSSMEDPVVPLQRNLYGHPSAGLLWEGQFEKVLLEHGWGKVPTWECLFVTGKRTILVCVCGRHETGWEETKHWPKVECTHETSRFGRTNIILSPRLFGLHSTRVRNEQRCCRQLQRDVWIQDLRRETWCKHLFMVLWHGRSYKEMCGAVFRAGHQINSATVQSLNSMPWWPSIQRRRIGICWRIVESMLSNCPRMPVFGTHWKTRHSMVCKQTCTSSHKMDQSLWQTLGAFDSYIDQNERTVSNIVMWEIPHNNAEWDCFRSLTLPEILKTQNRPREESCVFMEVTRLFP